MDGRVCAMAPLEGRALTLAVSRGPEACGRGVLCLLTASQRRPKAVREDAARGCLKQGPVRGTSPGGWGGAQTPMPVTLQRCWWGPCRGREIGVWGVGVLGASWVKV